MNRVAGSFTKTTRPRLRAACSSLEGYKQSNLSSKMLWMQRYGGSPVRLAAFFLILAFLATIYFLTPRGHSFSTTFAAITNHTSHLVSASYANLSRVDQGYVTKDPSIAMIPEASPRIRQVTMSFGSGDRGHNVIFERAMKTHLEHGKRWGYKTDILRQDVVGKGVASVSV